jgi:FtsH-binding integral membrane protein
MNKRDIENDPHDYHKLMDEDRHNGLGESYSSEVKIHQSIRLGFVRKVYGILSFQMILTTFCCFLSMASNTFFDFQKNNPWIMILTMVVAIIIPCLACCIKDVFRRVPQNYVLLTIFTFCISYSVGFICGSTNARIVLMAAFMTMGMTIALTVYAMTTKSDITMHGSLLLIVLTSMVFLSFFALFTDNQLIHVILSSLFVILYGIYIVYDTQLILGNHRYELDTEEYILASFMLYLDIINLFLNLLQILSYFFGSRDN